MTRLTGISGRPGPLVLPKASTDQGLALREKFPDEQTVESLDLFA
jgi:hypothetical protein